jgi:hypothetical protein
VLKWIIGQWNDVKGNIKFALLLAIGTVINTWVVALTRGLLAWQQLTLAGLFALMFGWSALMAGLHLARSRGNLQLGRDGDIAVPAKAPLLWVNYKPTSQDKRQTEALIFTKEGDGVIRNIKAGPLVWTIKEIRPVNILSEMGPLLNDPMECKFTAFQQIGTSQHVSELPELMREIMRKYGTDAQPSVDITYEDFTGNTFLRRFELSIDPYDRIAWNPGPVERISA